MPAAPSSDAVAFNREETTVIQRPTTMPTPATMGTPAPYLAHSTAPAVPRDRILRLPDVERLTGLKKSTIYDLAKDGRFPRQILIHRRMAGWSEAAVLTWIQSRIQGGAQ